MMHFCLGTIYIWSSLTPYVTSALRAAEPHYNVTYNDTLCIYATGLGIQSVFMIIAGVLEQRVGAKNVVFVGAAMFAMTVYMSSYATGFWSLWFFYGFMFGISVGLSYTTIIAMNVRWLPKQKSLVVGTIVCGVGLGSFTFGLLVGWLINPEGFDPGVDGYFPTGSPVINRVPIMFRTLGCIYASIFSVAYFLVSESPLQETDTKKFIVASFLNDTGGDSDKLVCAEKRKFKSEKMDTMSLEAQLPDFTEVESGCILGKDITPAQVDCIIHNSAFCMAVPK